MNISKILFLSAALLLGSQAAYAAENVETGITYYETDATKVYAEQNAFHTLVATFFKKGSRQDEYSACILTSSRGGYSSKRHLENAKYQYNRLERLHEQQQGNQSEQETE